MKDSKSGTVYYLVSARSKKWGMNERKTFRTEKEAVDHARSIEKMLQISGSQSNIPKETVELADRYLTLLDRLRPYRKAPEDAVDHYLSYLGHEVLRQAIPTVQELSEKWEEFKYTDSTLTKKTKAEIKQYAQFIRRSWGILKPDVPKRNEIDVLLRGMKISNNTRRKYLKYIRQFFSWVFNEGYITKNPTDGIFYKADAFEAKFYSVETTAKLLKHVAENSKPLIGYYSLLTFAGLRPTEGTRVEWDDINFLTKELYVRPGKTGARHIELEPAAIAWLNWHREQSPKDAPFVELRALPNREKEIRAAVLNGNWVQDGLRHGFATYFKNLKKDIVLTSHVMGNSVAIVKKHYARTIPDEECQAFWALTPDKVLADKTSGN
jgi:integrase